MSDIQPFYKIEIYDRTPTKIYTIEDELIDLRVKTCLTSNVGNFSFSLPLSADGFTFSYNDINPFYFAKIFLDWGDVPAQSMFLGTIWEISTPVTVLQGYRRTFKGRDLGYILQTWLKGARSWENVEADTIVHEVASDLGLGETLIEDDDTPVTLIIDKDRHDSYFNIMKAVSDYWASAELQIRKDFFVDRNSNLVWKSRPLRKVVGNKNGVADSGSKTTTVDSERTEANDYWNGCYIKYLSGSNAGFTQLVIDFDAATDTLTHTAFLYNVVAGDKYSLIGVETIPLADMTTYTMLRDLQSVKNWIHVYGAKERGWPYDKDTFTEYANFQIRTETDATANAGQKVVSVDSVTNFAANDNVLIISTVNQEENEVGSVDVGNVDLIMKNNLAYTYGPGALVVRLPGWYSGTGAGDVFRDTAFYTKGSASVRHTTTGSDYYGNACFYLGSAYAISTNDYPLLSFIMYLQAAFSGNVTVRLYDTAGKSANKNIRVDPIKWRNVEIKVGLSNQTQWEYIESGFDWDHIRSIDFSSHFPTVGAGSFWIDGLFFNDRCYYGFASDPTSYTNYGYRDLMILDDTLKSNEECIKRANSLLYQLCEVPYRLDFQVSGNPNILIGDRLKITLKPEGLENVDFDVLTVEQILQGDPIGWRTNVTALSTENLRTAPAISMQEFLIRHKLDNMEVAKGWLMVK